MDETPLPREGLSVLIVDDHQVFAEVMAMRLKAEPCIDGVTVAFSVDEARGVVRRTMPDLVLLDYDVAGRCGLELIPELMELAVPPHVLMLSGTSPPDSVVNSLESGAAGWVLKDGDLGALLAATSQVVHGHMHIDPSLLKDVVNHLIRASRGKDQTATFVDDLSPREVDVLRCLVGGMTRAEVAQHLHISPNTVRTHAQKLLRQADVHSTLALVAAARAAGLAPRSIG